ncbi:Hypothetical protein PENO1_089150 [Penicillium occitanis (nom. inval.)]|nr:Hypothetical protein PENO1_089150 [Penicillium occitanis (nom. inval.)]PCG95738.1 hypothetical protein PENOC_076280 [Penicillium occitanis (nom. inval.)]
MPERIVAASGGLSAHLFLSAKFLDVPQLPDVLARIKICITRLVIWKTNYYNATSLTDAYGLHVMLTLTGYIPSSITRAGCAGAGRRLSRSTYGLLTVRKFSTGHVNGQWQALTWTTQQPNHVTPDDIIPSYTRLLPSSKQSPIVPILFASPEFTAWTEPTGPLLSQWATPLLEQIHRSEAPKTVYTIVAVVDKVSSGGNISTSTEGLSLLLADSSCITASIATPARLKSNSSDEPAFFLATRKSETNAQSHEIGLRLAQTVFRNGRDRTLLGMRWTRDEASNNYILDRYHDLSSCSVTAPVQETYCAVNVPFHPVTQRRRVVSSMGNILRQVSKFTTDDGDTNAGIPASAELEKELPRYVSERGIPHQRVAVWALVEPAASSSTEITQQNIQNSLSQGSKIHRVVSGGGGWGKKQGLLSLDPEVTFAAGIRSREISLDEVFTAFSETDPVFTNDLPDFLEGLGLQVNIAQLSQVASPGDYIQFFVTSEDDINYKDRSTPSTLTYSFGVGSPDESSETSPTTSEGVVVIQNHFGAVSESAISYSQKDSSQASEYETKISVPGSRIDLSVA